MEEVIVPELRDHNQPVETGTREGLSGGMWRFGRRTVVVEETTLERQEMEAHIRDFPFHSLSTSLPMSAIDQSQKATR